jgi:hypothetical protein
VNDAELHGADDAFGAHDVVAEDGGAEREQEELHGPGRFWVDQGVEEDELVHAVGVAQGPVQTDGAAEVVHDEVRVVDAERVEDVGEEFEVVGDVEGFVGDAVAWEVDSDGAVCFCERVEEAVVVVDLRGCWDRVVIVAERVVRLSSSWCPQAALPAAFCACVPQFSSVLGT